MIYQPQPDPYADGDAAEKFILEATPEADPWQLGWEEGEVYDSEIGNLRFGWIRYDGKTQ